MEMETVIIKCLEDSRRQEKRSASKIQELENEIRRLKSKERRQQKPNQKKTMAGIEA